MKLTKYLSLLLIGFCLTSYGQKKENKELAEEKKVEVSDVDALAEQFVKKVDISEVEKSTPDKVDEDKKDASKKDANKEDVKVDKLEKKEALEDKSQEETKL